jgi:hypothetical protein
MNQTMSVNRKTHVFSTINLYNIINFLNFYWQLAMTLYIINMSKLAFIIFSPWPYPSICIKSQNMMFSSSQLSYNNFSTKFNLSNISKWIINNDLLRFEKIRLKILLFLCLPSETFIFRTPTINSAISG